MVQKRKIFVFTAGAIVAAIGVLVPRALQSFGNRAHTPESEPFRDGPPEDATPADNAPPGMRGVKGDTAGTGNRDRAPGDLTYHPPRVDHPGLRAFVNRQAHADRVHGDMAARFPQLTSERDIAAVAAVLKDTADDDTVRHEAAAMLARSDYDKLVSDLLAVLNHQEEGPRFRGWVVQHLQQNYADADAQTQAQIREQLQAALDDRHTTVRREALLALHRITPAEALPVARKWLHDDSAAADAVRDLAIRVVREQNARDELSQVRRYARDENTVVRIAALVTLAAWNDHASRAAMEDAAASDSTRLRRCGQRALQQLGPAPED